MRQRHVLLFVLSLVPACGPTSVMIANNGSPDGGASADGGGGDGASQDSGTDDSATIQCPAPSADPGLADAAAPSGTQLQAGDALSIRGVTSDGYVIYSDDAARSLHAIPITGGSVTDLGALGDKFWVVVSGKIVFVWSNVTGANVGALSTWSAATGVHAVASASLGLAASSSPDHIVYVDHASASADKGDIYLAAVDGSGSKNLVTGAFLAGCAPELGFVGSYAMASHCDSAVGATPMATISSFTLDTATRADLATSAENYWASSGTSDVLVSKDGVGVDVVPVAGGSPTLIDASGFFGVLAAGGNVALYGTKSGELRRSPVVSPSPSTLISSGFGGFWAMSPDEQWTLYFSRIGGAGGDIYMASTMTPGTPVVLSSSQTGILRGDAFTANTSHVVYSTGFDPCTGSATLDAIAVGGGSPRALGNQSWMNRSIGGSKVVFTDGFVATTDSRFGRADVEYADLAQSDAPTRLVDRADAVIGISPAGDQLVYVWSARAGSLAGLYVTAIP